jgi:hypothetical protein
MKVLRINKIIMPVTQELKVTIPPACWSYNIREKKFPTLSLSFNIIPQNRSHKMTDVRFTEEVVKLEIP